MQDQGFPLRKHCILDHIPYRSFIVDSDYKFRILVGILVGYVGNFDGVVDLDKWSIVGVLGLVVAIKREADLVVEDDLSLADVDVGLVVNEDE